VWCQSASQPNTTACARTGNAYPTTTHTHAHKRTSRADKLSNRLDARDMMAVHSGSEKRLHALYLHRLRVTQRHAHHHVSDTQPSLACTNGASAATCMCNERR
jgi:hypothetical protein